MKKIFALFLIIAVFVFTALAQNSENPQQPGAFKVGDRVEVEVIADSGKWFPATISEIMDEGYTYKVKVAPYDDGKEVSRNIHFKRVRAVSIESSNSSGKTDNNKTNSGKLVFGKYGCTSSKYNSSTGFYEYTPHGSFVISTDGKYSYIGFEKPSKGTFTIDEKGVLHFKSGYLDGGEATPIDRPNKFFLVYPTIPDNRWTCGLVE